MPMTTTEANRYLDELRGTTHYLALFSSMPTDAGGGTELTSVTAPGYARKALSASNLSAASAKQLVNSAAITFAAATSDGPTVVGWAIFTALTAGTMKIYSACEPIAWLDDRQIEWAIGKLVVNIT
jgi:hypothetical protein